MRSRGRSRNCEPEPVGRCAEDGSTIVEAVIAASLTLLAAGVVVGNVIVPLSTLEERLGADGRAAELDAAAEGLARIVRAARSSNTHGPVVSASAQELVLQVGAGDEVLTVALVDDALLVSAHSATSGGAPLPTGRLAHGIDVTQSGFMLLGAGGVEVEDPLDALAVRLRVGDGPHQVERAVALRGPARSGGGSTS